MRIALVCEKKSLASEIIDVLSELHPFDQSAFTAVIGHSVQNLDWAFAAPDFESSRDRFRYPRRVAWSDYPVVVEPVYKPLQIANDAANRPFQGVHCGTGASFGGRFHLNAVPDDFDVRPAFMAADLVVVAMDASSPSIHTADRILGEIFPDGLEGRPVVFPWITDMQREKLAAAVRGAKPWKEVRDAHLSHSRIKRHFTYNYAVNALGLFGRAFEQASDVERSVVDRSLGNSIVTSRNSLQVLYHLSDQECPVGEGDLIWRMSKWAGTGRHVGVDAMFGSSSSRADIVFNLLRSGLVESAGRRFYLRISTFGRRYLERLHPDCRDSDQGFRLEEWRTLGEDEAKPKIDRYIRTFFGKQKRFLARSTSA